MKAYISQTFTSVTNFYSATSTLDPICAFCGDKIYSEPEPADLADSWGIWGDMGYFHISDNTPICDAQI